MFLKRPNKNKYFLDFLNKNKHLQELDENIKNLKKRQKILEQELIKTPKVVWKKNNKNFSLILDSKLPINDIELSFENNTPDWVFIDENYNNIFDLNELKFYKKKNKIKLNTILFSNRINITSEGNLFNDNIITAATRFNLISSNNNLPSGIKVSNFFTEKPILVEESQELTGSQTNQLNKVLFDSSKVNKKI